ncbi:Nuclear envelope morphology protein 1 [Neolecta irregularis DAH-3]|uniref:Nuclear envelope morphology protein 1 n=1 Tax=Neolecta irregularis (strain DAH-3) TaxID=1198029 RepID=A0A1U7LIC5_NEOID|nr:Nuclear envelope morphology protein 1 [Neolecta irregularis DAH-3]|eukprot:OLL22405.1 Nuclear envelope morphology protein 1 [Neolecta irregularis DAH-3]
MNALTLLAAKVDQAARRSPAAQTSPLPQLNASLKASRSPISSSFATFSSFARSILAFVLRILLLPLKITARCLYRNVFSRFSLSKPPISDDPRTPSSSDETEGSMASARSVFSISSTRRSPRTRLSSQSHASLKSPNSPDGLETDWLKTIPHPPRPLIPKKMPAKTLVLDLDETLIHSLVKGGSMAGGHMVEVKFDRHAILYFVYKRPFCDQFLKKVAKWYNLVIFTASVQEYADPVIDWLESDRKYFKKRYYRQHCTFKDGFYIKDLGKIHDDLSNIMILDNSPRSYISHEENAIPIEGWISDPSDLDLLCLVPFLHSLRFVTDVRTLLGLRLMGNRDPLRL